MSTDLFLPFDKVQPSILPATSARSRELPPLDAIFAMANPTGFHRKDGLAYDFFAEEIVALDRRNPQVAARVMTSVRSWRALEAGSREKLRSAIAKIASSNGISRDLADIARRTLG